MTLSRSILAFSVYGLAACSGGDTTSPPPSAEETLIASKVAIAALAVATGSEGVSFFDNFISCPRRGVIDYRNITGGRRATFSGCDLGDGVVVDGTTDIRFTVNNSNRATITSLSVGNGLRAHLNGGAESSVDPLDVGGISFTGSTPGEGLPLLDRLGIPTVRVRSGGSEFSLDARATPANVFRPAITATSIPNASNSLVALEERDVKRIAYDPVLVVASILFNETLEIQRGPHSHTSACGTFTVTPTDTLTRLRFDWNNCDIGDGSFVSGQFTAEWGAFSSQSGHMRMVLDGAITLGGGVPRTTFTRIEWDVSGITTFPANARFSGRLATASGERPYDFSILVDD